MWEDKEEYKGTWAEALARAKEVAMDHGVLTRPVRTDEALVHAIQVFVTANGEG